MFLFSFTQSPFIAHFLRAARFVLNVPVPLTERLPFISRFALRGLPGSILGGYNEPQT
jgi:hypothetical protein